jgi:hypothetical protein
MKINYSLKLNDSVMELSSLLSKQKEKRGCSVLPSSDRSQKELQEEKGPGSRNRSLVQNLLTAKTELKQQRIQRTLSTSPDPDGVC